MLILLKGTGVVNMARKTGTHPPWRQILGGLRLFMRSVLAASSTEFFDFDFVFLGTTPGKRVIPVLAVGAGENVGNPFSHD